VAAVESVLGQTFSDFEIVIVDDGSSDRTSDVLAQYSSRLHYVRQRNAGQAAARNRGIAEGSGTYIAFLDGDDVWTPRKLERQLAPLLNRDDVGVSYCACLVVDEELRTLREYRSRQQRDLSEDLLLEGNVVGIPGAVVVRKELLERVGGFDTGLEYCCDWDLWIRLARHTEFAYIDEPLVCWRQHSRNLTRQVELLERDSVALLQKTLHDPKTPSRLRTRASRVMGRNWMVLAGSYFGVRRYRDFLRCATRAVALDPRQLGRLIRYPPRRFTQ
jgi:glycosyltransferase involved in cell wall biosynthesis